MSEISRRVLFFSNLQFTESELLSFASKGYSLVSSKGKARLIDEVLSLKPFGLVIDVKYCAQRSLPCSFILQKLQHSLTGIPVFLINGTNINYLELIQNELVYAFLKDDVSLIRLAGALDQYSQIGKRGGGPDRMRFGVSVPCVMKKLGSSGLAYGQICDLSPKGMKVVLNVEQQDWLAGDEIRFSFNQCGDRGVHLEGYGRLRWALKHEGKPGSQMTRLGVEFSQLPKPTLVEVLEILNDLRSRPLNSGMENSIAG